MELRDITLDDLDLFVRIHCDPRMMQELGGPLTRAGLSDKLRQIVADVAADRTWYFTVRPDAEATTAGTVCVWLSELRGEPVNEIGWMILPEFQGRGLATQAVSGVLDRARSTGRWDLVHAFPGITNGPSNAICRKTGFTRLEECDVEFAGRLLRCHHWRIDLRAGGTD